MAAAAAAAYGAPFANRYPKVSGYNHQIYLEGYDLPVLNAGPSDPAPSPDGRSLAFSARGWLWVMDLEKRVARRVTSGAAMDFRPAFSPDGTRLAFVRDTGQDTSIVGLELASGKETVLAETAAMELDPAYAADGTLYYSSGAAGDIDIWRLRSGAAPGHANAERVTSDAGVELRAQPGPGGVLYFVLKQRLGADAMVALDTGTGKRTTVREEWIASQMRPALAADGSRLAVTLPLGDDDGLFLLDPRGGALIQLAHSARLPIQPAFSAAGDAIYYVDADAQQRFHVMRIPQGGGAAEDLEPRSWDWGVPTRTLTVVTTYDGVLSPARLAVTDASGHPALPDGGQPRFDSSSGAVYVATPGRLAFTVPSAGAVTARATRGFTAAAARAIGAGAELRVALRGLVDLRAHGYYSGDHHWHVNYGGPYRLQPQDVVAHLRGEDLDVATPQVANLHTRFKDRSFWGATRSTPPLMAFAQEVRAHFLGHIGLVGAGELFWPWYWGPGYPSLGRDDRENADALRFARRRNGFGFYVHPVRVREPFASVENLKQIPLELIPDAVLGDLDGLEVACLWTDELGTSDLWYRLLNLGLPIVPTGGTDAFPNFYRAIPVGSTRVFVKPRGPLTMQSYLAALRAGRSFVSNGPLLLLRAAGQEPGGVAAPAAKAAWTLTLASPTAVERVEILVNGRVVETRPGLDAAGTKAYRGEIALPSGGWLAARAHGGTATWPATDGDLFAHTAPIWIGTRGSRDPEAARAAAGDLLKWMDVGDRQLRDGYQDAPIPKLSERFARARRVLQQLAAQ